MCYFSSIVSLLLNNKTIWWEFSLLCDESWIFQKNKQNRKKSFVYTLLFLIAERRWMFDPLSISEGYLPAYDSSSSFFIRACCSDDMHSNSLPIVFIIHRFSTRNSLFECVFFLMIGNDLISSWEMLLLVLLFGLLFISHFKWHSQLVASSRVD